MTANVDNAYTKPNKAKTMIWVVVEIEHKNHNPIVHAFTTKMLASETFERFISEKKIVTQPEQVELK